MFYDAFMERRGMTEMELRPRAVMLYELINGVMTSDPRWWQSDDGRRTTGSYSKLYMRARRPRGQTARVKFAEEGLIQTFVTNNDDASERAVENIVCSLTATAMAG